MAEPWRTEPDCKDWMAHGFVCAIRRHGTMKHLCGYVAVPKGHPWYGCTVEDEGAVLGEVVVHGGITWEGPLPVGPVDAAQWWLGFDCAHWNDFVPGHANYSASDATYRDMEYVVAETERLAEQAAQAARAVKTNG